MSNGAWVRIMGADGKIKTFTIKKFPYGGLKTAAVIEFEGALLVKSKSGSLYGGGRIPTTNGSYHGWTWGWLPRLAKCLNFLGLITEDDMNATIKKHQEAVEKQAADLDKISFLKHAERLGLKDAAEVLLENVGGGRP